MAAVRGRAAYRYHGVPERHGRRGCTRHRRCRACTLETLHRGRRRGAEAAVDDGVEERAVADDDGRRGEIAGARVVEKTRGDGARDRVEGGVRRRLGTSRVVRRVDAHGRKRVAAAGVLQLEGVDAAVGGRGRCGGGAAARQGDGGRSVPGAADVDLDRDDGATVGDRGLGSRACAGAADADVRGGVAAAGVGDGDAGDGAVAADRRRRRRASADAAGVGDGDGGIGQRQRAQHPVGPGPEVVRVLPPSVGPSGQGFAALGHLDHEQ